MGARFVLDRPEELLASIANAGEAGVNLDDVDVAEVFSLVGLSTLARIGQAQRLKVSDLDRGAVARFAHALGFESVVVGDHAPESSQPDRTVPLARVAKNEPYEQRANAIAKLLMPDERDAEARKTVYYVLVELMRNVMQHSLDPLGGVVAGQADRAAPRRVQVAVADAGIGIHTALKGMHPDLIDDPEAALDRALWPHVSGTFEAGMTGNAVNAGMGLFFISEMTKLTGGKLLVASRAAALLLESNPADVNDNRMRFLAPKVGFPGTLVAFSTHIDNVHDHDSMIETIRERAVERTPQRTVHRWLRFEDPPSEVKRFMVKVAGEDTPTALAFARETLQPRIVARAPLALDFRNVSVCTQSHMHAMLYEPIRLAWALKIPIYVLNARPAIRSGLELLENYALGG